MTPEEKAVIEAAMLGWGDGCYVGADESVLGTAVEALIFSCPQCNAGGHTCPGDGNPIGHTQTDCGQHEEPTHALAEKLIGAPIGPVRSSAGDANWRAKRVEESYRAEVLKQEWIPATLVLCLAGDHIRMGADETDVLRSSAGIWHADTSDAWHPRAWRHTELRMDLSANPGFQEYPPNLPCEILCTPERKAALLLQQAFPGSAVISSDVD